MNNPELSTRQSQASRLGIALIAFPIAAFAAWIAWLIVPAIVEEVVPAVVRGVVGA